MTASSQAPGMERGTPGVYVAMSAARMTAVPRTPQVKDFEAYYGDRYPYWVGVATLLNGNDAQAAEDLVQSTFTKLYPKWKTIVSKGDPHALFRRALVNNWRSTIRRRMAQKRPRETLTAELVEHRGTENCPIDTWVDVEGRRQALAQSLAQLPEGERLVIVLRELEDLPWAVVAEQAGMKVAGVRSAHRRARRKLAHLYPQVGGEL